MIDVCFPADYWRNDEFAILQASPEHTRPGSQGPPARCPLLRTSRLLTFRRLAPRLHVTKSPEIVSAFRDAGATWWLEWLDEQRATFAQMREHIRNGRTKLR